MTSRRGEEPVIAPHEGGEGGSTPTPASVGPTAGLHTVIVSDMHLSDAEAPDKRRPHWKAYKWRQFFFDEDFRRLLEHIDAQASGPIELVLAGDIFDFDNITALPPKPPGLLHWLARLRGLGTEEWMSRFKIGRIIADHEPWFRALARFIAQGHKVVFVIGNHDLEVFWTSVQQHIREALRLDEAAQERLVFCNWFYVSDGDTYVSHGHMYDDFCTIRDPIDPLISVAGTPKVRLPFGDHAERYMLNGMGYFNPHATSNFIMSLKGYVRFYLKYMLRTQPFLFWTWFWGAAVTLFMTLRDFILPPMRDPLAVDEKVASIAERAQVTPPEVRKLNALHVPSACTNPIKIVRELWLDRGLLFLGMLWAAFQLVTTINFIYPINPWWVLLAVALLFPLFLSYSFKVQPATFTEPLLDEERAGLIARITGVERAVMGHTHKPEHCRIGPLDYWNSGFWSPAFAEPECRVRIGTQTFVWIQPRDRPPGPGETRRVASLWEWPPHGEAPLPFDPPPCQKRESLLAELLGIDTAEFLAIGRGPGESRGSHEPSAAAPALPDAPSAGDAPDLDPEAATDR